MFYICIEQIKQYNMSQERIIKDLVVVKGNATHVRVSLTYNIGGHNYFTGSNERRGLYLSVSPLTISGFKGGFRSISYTGFSGSKVFVKELKRFSKKALETFEVEPDTLKFVLDTVLYENNITLVEHELFA